jgi:hypothetical protein
MNAIVQATEELFARWPRRPTMETSSVFALKNGRPIGVSGGYVDADQGVPVFYGDFTDELRAEKRLLLRLARAGLAQALTFGSPVYALADPEVKGSDVLLRHLGGLPFCGRVFEFEGGG